VNIGATLVGQTIAFILFVWFCMKYVWPPITSLIEERQEKIAAGLADAERAKKDLQLAQNKAAELLKEAKAQANEIVDGAHQRKTQLIDEAKREAENERNKIIAQGKLEIEAERNRVKEELRLQVANLAMAGAEKILGRSVDAVAQNDIVEKLVAEI